jgi:cytochrome P450 family 109
MTKHLDWQSCQKVFVWIPSANRNPATLSDSDPFDIKPAANQPTFGHGVHYCLGEPLARIEDKLILQMMQEQLRDLQQANANLPAIATEAGTIVGVKNIPVVFVLSKLGL